MDLNAIDVPDHDKIFSLATITSKGELEAAAEVNLDQVTDDQVLVRDDDEDDLYVSSGSSSEDEDDGDDDDDKEEQVNYKLHKEMDDAYDRYLSKTTDARAKSGTKMAKRSKKSQRLMAIHEAEEDQQMLLSGKKGISADTKRYIQMLAGQNNQNDDDDDDDDDDDHSRSSQSDDDGFHTEPMTPDEHNRRKKEAFAATEEEEQDDNDDDNDNNNKNKNKNKKKNSNKKAVQVEDDRNPLIHEFHEPASAKTARWFSNPLFSTIGQTAESASSSSKQGSIHQHDPTVNIIMDSSSDEDDTGDDSTDDNDNQNKNKKKKKKKPLVGLNADDVIAMMPKTDKQKRHEKRLKAMAAEERKKAKRAKRWGESETEAAAGFEIAPADDDDDDDDDDDNDNNPQLSKEQQQKILKARQLIKAGMGSAILDTSNKNKNDKDNHRNNNNNNNNKSDKLEIVPAEEDDDDDLRLLPPRMDQRTYGSDEEDYDSDDYARTLALGTMMLRNSKAKALVDASYNRYAWNDPDDLPEWFVDDENKYYRPQLPIPQALVNQMKEKVMALSAKPIAKVAEARARKNRRVKAKLAAARKQAEIVANSSDMTESMKLKAISKALRSPSSSSSKPGKTYVVAKKGGGRKNTGGGGKGIKLVDKRIKNDKRAMERKAKKRKHGKQGGLTGTKKRRHHS